MYTTETSSTAQMKNFATTCKVSTKKIISARMNIQYVNDMNCFDVLSIDLVQIIVAINEQQKISHCYT